MQSAVAIQFDNLIHYLSNLLAKNLEEGHQVAVWRQPKSQFLHILIDSTGETKRVSPILEELTPGFIVHPFEDQEDKKAYFLQASTYFKINLQLSFEDYKNDLNDISEIKSIEESAKRINKSLITDGIEGLRETHFECTRQDFINLVEKGIEEIKAERLNKIVPAKLKKIELHEQFDLVKSIKRLIESYPNAFVNFFHIPKVGSWLGASPEVLIQTKGDQFSTMSLAGTQKVSGENPLKNTAWTQKEIEEQALVSRYIVDCFKKIRLREYDEIGPKTVMAGNLLHLRSDFKVNMKNTNFPKLGSVMLELLHPTSAVCGMPRKEAFDFLRLHEKFDRSLFAGFIGPVNIEDETAIYVNLRTARLMEGFAILYAGAGVTEDSIPEKEWEETEMKCDIIGRHLNLTDSL
ncbi:isochorismate synthase [Belliella baltica DSM 15883]|uniref:Isochorismate synthase n=1 Tax=Belliella baltica (strain DSM 15883 / CIP 108006 / LMG 21964 / BA134) TaxID=866536 RepID=I3Z6E1_BELBD|nr:chorismate-binding protein [Belliella baltica]AFL84809.1 isochorismate synthase [Belliella baltica DSM 15883]